MLKCGSTTGECNWAFKGPFYRWPDGGDVVPDQFAKQRPQETSCGPVGTWTWWNNLSWNINKRHKVFRIWRRRKRMELELCVCAHVCARLHVYVFFHVQARKTCCSIVRAAFCLSKLCCVSGSMVLPQLHASWSSARFLESLKQFWKKQLTISPPSICSPVTVPSSN